MLRLFALVLISVCLRSNLAAQTGESYNQLKQTFNQCVHLYPSDSASLYRMYFLWQNTRDDSLITAQTERMRVLLTEETRMRYRFVERALRPLLVNIVKRKSITKFQANKLVLLYSSYDQMQGEGLFSHLLSEEENYQLVWKSLNILAQAARKDTFFISAIIMLSDSIRTNVELSESMPDFLIASLRNNPKGFLQIYENRDAAVQQKLLSDIAPENVMDENVTTALKQLVRSTKDEKVLRSAKNLLKLHKLE